MLEQKNTTQPSLGSLARSIHGDIPSAFEKLHQLEPDFQKHQLYALSALFINRFMQRIDIGKIEPPDFREPLDSSGRYRYDLMRDTIYLLLAGAWAEERVELEGFEYSKNPEEERLFSLYLYSKRLLIQNDLGQYDSDFDRFVRAGIGTSADVTTAFARLIPEVFEAQFPNTTLKVSELDEIAQNSYSLINSQASLCALDFIGRWTELKGDYLNFSPLNADFFELIDAKEGLRLIIKDTINKHDDTYLQKWEKSGVDKLTYHALRVGCPAAVNFGEGSAVKKLFHIALIYARQIWQTRYPQESTSS